MIALPPYKWPSTYPWHWVWTGWDGVRRTIDRTGNVVPAFPPERNVFPAAPR